jgi:5-methylcytosine-specific restriction endonuclease McrA
MALNLQMLSSVALVDGLKRRVQTERKITSEIIEFTQEINRRKVYLEYEVTSLFAFLTKVIGYSRSAAQRRIEAASLSNEIPEIHESLKSGELNLSHVSLLAQCLKQKESESTIQVSKAQKQELIEKLKSQTIERCEVIVSQELDLKLKAHDVCRHQKDESIRAEMTFSKSEMAEIERAKSLLSHQLGNPKLSELFMVLVRDVIKRKDPLQRKITPVSGHTQRQSASANDSKMNCFLKPSSSKPSRYIPRAFDKILHLKDRSCRWKDPKTGNLCESTFQLQRDHIVPIWAGGTNGLENLQLLCAVHNKEKYRREAGITLSDQVAAYIKSPARNSHHLRESNIPTRIIGPRLNVITFT